MLFLVGFMAAGKTSVGRVLAAASGRRFVDLDDAIAEDAGEPASAVVARDEAEFRRREADALARLIASAGAGGDLVIATGGGAAAFGDNLARMRAAGLVVALDVTVAESRRRAAGGPPRPLLANAEALAAQRAPAYRRAHAVIDTTGRTLDDVVAQVRAVEAAWARLPDAARGGATILALGERSYPIVTSRTVDPALVRAALGEPTRIAVITDANVVRAQPALAAALGDTILPIAPGEASKSFPVYERVCGELVARGLDRGSGIVALGGGVVGDLSGFVAATLFRGIPVVQVPTSLVAMIDAAIGGKTGIDAAGGKNLVGAFHQPRLVACGSELLSTLPARERRAGFGELWKYALLGGRALWDRVAACAAWSAAGEGAAPPDELDEAIAMSIALKAAIVSRDELERSGQRALLNLGHTIGHAIESAGLWNEMSGDARGALLHGEAVALGLLAACRVSRAVFGEAAHDLEPELRAALAASGLPTDLDRWLTDDVVERVTLDKKRSGNVLRYVTIRSIGACEVTDIAVSHLQEILRSREVP